MEVKDQVRILMQTLNHLQAASQVLLKAIDQEEEELLLQEWRQRWECERLDQRRRDARN
jgi:hypothetical protein